MNALHRLGALVHPASLRGRVVLGVLSLLTVLLVALFLIVDLLLSARLYADLRTRLTDRVTLARQLDGALSPVQVVNRIRGDGVTALLCAANANSALSDSGGLRCVQGDGAQPPPGGNGPGSQRRPDGPGGNGPDGRPPVHPQGTDNPVIRTAGPVLYVRTSLPSTQEILTLSVDSSQVRSTLRGLLVLETVGGLVAVLLAALVSFRVVGVALRPLDRMTSLARRIAGGDRGQRLGQELGGTRADTELGRTGAAFDAMLDELESSLAAAAAAEARLRAFLNDVSHELRTPLAGLGATTESLLRDEPEHRAERERLYVTLMRETQRAGRLVGDLLTMTRLDTGVTLTTAPSDLISIIDHELDRVRMLAPDLEIETSMPDSVAVSVDATRLGQVVANVLNNSRTAAGRFGKIRVSVDTTDTSWHVDIADSGPGVSPHDADRIFDRLVRLDSARSRDGGGFGLGLPIARAIARAHGGDLVCVPEPAGGGALFRLTVPRTDE